MNNQNTEDFNLDLKDCCPLFFGGGGGGGGVGGVDKVDHLFKAHELLITM
jgi:hypothetical protein